VDSRELSRARARPRLSLKSVTPPMATMTLDRDVFRAPTAAPTACSCRDRGVTEVLTAVKVGSRFPAPRVDMDATTEEVAAPACLHRDVTAYRMRISCCTQDRGVVVRGQRVLQRNNTLVG
jgi:hypothetical protein